MVSRLRELRLERGWTQKALAVRVGVSQMSISGYERGPTIPSPSVNKKLAQALGVTVLDLVDKTETQNQRELLSEVPSVLRLDLSMDRVPPYWQTDDEGNLIRWKTKRD